MYHRNKYTKWHQSISLGYRSPDASDEAVVIVDKREFCRKLAGRNILKKQKQNYFIDNNKCYPLVT